MINNVIVECEEGMPVPQWSQNLAQFAQSVLEALDKKGWELSILLCTDPFMAKVNKEYRDIDGPTDVLSFEQGDEYLDDDGKRWFMAGDILISLDTLVSNAREFGVSADEELKRLIIHGVLHLDGMDHETNDSGEPMLIRQEEILRRFSSVRVYGLG
jgi:probable rRNA maturation factor